MTANAPNANGGVMLLLTDGTVMVKTFVGGTDAYGNTWNKLTPNSTGSYVNGTWTTLAPMADTRLYFSSQVLKDGRVFVAGGEYGTGGSLGETYDPVTNTWTSAPAQGQRISDANSEILPDGRVLVALVTGNLRSTIIFDPATNTWTAGPTANGIHNESAWVKLPDGSSLMVDRLSTNSERYVPSLNQWVVDATVPVDLYDPYGDETGPGFLLPDGRAFFIGSPSNTAYYTPSGTTSFGTWAAGPPIPNAQGAPDAAGAMMPNGKILCVLSPTPTATNHFPTPTTFYEFDYTTDTFTLINAPAGGTSANIPPYITNMLVLPDGTVLYAQQNSSSYYVYNPGGAPLASGKPAITSVAKNPDNSYHLTGTQLNGISQGAAYGDDWQMATNYPLVRLTAGSSVFYARTFNWSSTGVMTGNTPVTTEFTLPAGLPAGTYSLAVVANGISSDPVAFTVVGPLHHFAWNGIASPQSGNSAFSTTITAQDSANNTVTAFSGTVNLSGHRSNPAGSSVVITEVNPNTSDTVEFMNVSTAAVDISGWTIHVYDDASFPNPLTAFTIPSGTTCAAGQVFRFQDNGIAPGTFPLFRYGSNISWTASTSLHAAVMLRNAAGTIVDFVAIGSAIPGSISLPLPVPASHWSGATVTATTSTAMDYTRKGSSDANSATDWSTASLSLGTVNTGLTTPFPSPTTPVSITPSVSGNFVNGVVTGNLSVSQAAIQMMLRADDGSGHTGDSNAFDVSLPPAVSTNAATAITGTGATLNGIVNANAGTVAVSFDYGTSTSYGTNITAATSPVTGSSNTAVSAIISGLDASTTYHFRATGTNVNGSVNGSDVTFTTLPWSAQDWRQKWFATPSNAGLAADDADPYFTGVQNLSAFALLGPNQNPALASVTQLPQAHILGGNLVFTFPQPGGVSEITYGADWRLDLDSGSWQPVTDTGSGNVHTFSVPIGSSTKLFMRLRVSEP